MRDKKIQKDLINLLKRLVKIDTSYPPGNSKNFVDERIASFDLQDTCMTIEGDIVKSLPDFIKKPSSRFTKSGFFCRGSSRCRMTFGVLKVLLLSQNRVLKFSFFFSPNI